MSIMTPEVENRIIYKALLSHFVEQRLLTLFAESKLFGTVHTCIGQEFSGATITEHLIPGDTIFSSHRCHGHFLSMTNDTQGLIAELMGKESGVCGGMGGSQHLYKNGFHSNGIQGGTVPVACGIGLAHKFNKKNNISVVFIGDGTLGEGTVYETMNIASKWNIPLLIVLEDNGYAQSTNKNETLAGDILARAQSFAIQTEHANTWEWKNLYYISQNLISTIRIKQKPGFLLVDTFRLKAHSKGDDNRPPELVKSFEEKDPVLNILKKPSKEILHMVENIKIEIEKSVKTAELQPYPKIKKQPENNKYQWEKKNLDKKRIVTSLNETFHELMNENKNIIFIGEDVKSPYGGAFKVSAGLSDKFSDRVFNSPISEAAIVGIGNGLGISSYRPMIEIMFGDFLGLAFDQIVNHAAKFEQMYNYQIKNNIIIRTPMGGGRGYGPTHSQTLDRHFLGTPGLKILALSTLVDPKQIYSSIIQNDSGPILVIENKILYGAFLKSELPNGFELYHGVNKSFPVAYVKPQTNKTHITMIAYGGNVELMLKATDLLFNEHDLIIQCICPTQIYPIQVSDWAELLLNTKAIVTIEEGQGFGSFSSEVITQITELGLQNIKAVKRIHPIEHCIPASGQTEKELLPSIQMIVQTCLDLNCKNI